MKFLFAWRYFKAKKTTNAINVIAWVSVVAIIIGTASLIIVLSVFNGLEDLVKSLYSSFYTDIKISPQNGKFITLSSEQLQQLKVSNAISGYSLVVEDKALLQYQSLQPVILKGVDSNYTNITGVSKSMVKGKFDLGTADQPGIVMGAGIENALGIESDRSVLPLSVYLFNKNHVASTDPMESVSSSNMAATGAFVIQQDFDNKYAITNLGFMQQMLGLKPNEYTNVEISLHDPKQTDAVAASLKKIFGSDYLVQTRYEQNQNLYSVMRVEKWVIYCVLTLILIVAAFNMVGALTMLVLEKQKDIQILKALGANNNYIQRIFLNEGMLLALLGGIGGILLAIFMCWLQVKYKLVPLQGESFLIDHYPVKLVAGDFILVLSTIFIVALLASWIPSRKAAMEPIELRS
ncbi:MAG: ABC transporter permease [Bacteroidetes bacterium]|nr:ABC transporter permease [Bacteroidota bacterium]